MEGDQDHVKEFALKSKLEKNLNSERKFGT